MKTNKQRSFSKVAIALSFALTLTGTAMAKGKPDHHHHRDGLRHMLKALDLSTEQRQDIRQLLKQTRADKSVFNQDKHDFHDQMRALIQSTSFDTEAVSALLAERFDEQAEQNFQRASTRHEIWALLTAEQKAKLASLVEERVQDMDEGGPDKLPGSKLFTKLELSEEQQASIDNLHDTMWSHREANRENMRTYFAAMKSLINSDDFSQASWEQLNASHQADKLSAELNHAEVRNKVWNVLTAEQQVRLNELMENRMGRK